MTNHIFLSTLSYKKTFKFQQPRFDCLFDSCCCPRCILLLIPLSVISNYLHLSLPACSPVLASSSSGPCLLPFCQSPWVTECGATGISGQAHTKGHWLVRDDHGRHEEWSWHCLHSLHGSLQCDVSCFYPGKECRVLVKVKKKTESKVSCLRETCDKYSGQEEEVLTCF